jgi:hypothetical protein
MAMQLSDVAGQQGAPESRVRALQTDAAAFMITAEGGPLGTPGS